MENAADAVPKTPSRKEREAWELLYWQWRGDMASAHRPASFLERSITMDEKMKFLQSAAEKLELLRRTGDPELQKVLDNTLESGVENI
jgi:hypothetical protein